MKSPRKPAAVPQTRWGRLARIGIAAAELAAGTAIEGLRGLARPTPPGSPALFSAGNARRLAKRLATMRGAAMKLGQMISLQGDDVLPPEFAQALAVLRSGAAPMPPAQLHRVLGREYGKGWASRFEDFDEEPVAAASIGQVHRVRARDGRDIALKIQYPGVARSIDSDVDNVASLLRLFSLLPVELDVSAIAAEAKRQLAQEADYLQEARFIETYSRWVADEPAFVVPRVHADLTTTRILAMDFIEGVPLESLSSDNTSQAERDAIGSHMERLMFRELFEFRLMQTDPNFANYLYLPASRRIALLDFGATQAFSEAFVANYVRVTRAIVDDDREALSRAVADIGYIDAADSPEAVRAVLDVILLVCEPLRHRGRYDFAASGLAARARTLTLDLVMRQGLLRRAPPAETMFLHRKLVGSFLLLARLGARVDARA
ncbi:MAG TPA: AarF/ABC1/UbiB kinase family protein, partial [Albitalea sp.]|nr:AarF/ABC1/UbiB kinase family protein [Albitalea sp.]